MRRSAGKTRGDERSCHAELFNDDPDRVCHALPLEIRFGAAQKQERRLALGRNFAKGEGGGGVPREVILLERNGRPHRRVVDDLIGVERPHDSIGVVVRDEFVEFLLDTPGVDKRAESHDERARVKGT